MRDMSDLGFKRIKGNKPSIGDRVVQGGKSIVGGLFKSAKRTIFNEPLSKEEFAKKLERSRQDRILASERASLAKIQAKRARSEAIKSDNFRSSLYGGTSSFGSASSYDVMTGESKPIMNKSITQYSKRKTKRRKSKPRRR